MNQEQVIELAEQAGFDIVEINTNGKDTLEILCVPEELVWMTGMMSRFAARVEQATLERAAVACEQSESYRGSVFAARIRALKDDV